MANRVVTVDGQPFQIEYQGQWSPEVESQVVAMARATNMGCSSCGGARVMAAGSCPAEVVRGSTHALSGTGSGGQTPYSFAWVITRPDYKVDSLVGSNPNYTFSLLGNYTISMTVTDSCSTPQTCTSSCVTKSVEAVRKYRCTGAPDYACVEDPSGPYSSVEACRADCVAPVCPVLGCGMQML